MQLQKKHLYCLSYEKYCHPDITVLYLDIPEQGWLFGPPFRLIFYHFEIYLFCESRPI